MSKDPFYQQIVDKLDGELDPSLFEECIADILRKIYPTLVSIRGGNDAGMDGAIADLEGEPFPLVVTTSENVIGNLSKNLKSYLKAGRKRRKVILATSRNLSPRRKQNLFDRAEKMGFLMVQAYTQPDIASLLYYYPNWCKTLLNLDGKPSALSLFPKSARPEVNETIIARELDFQWLVETSGDRLLIGHPGSGKTFLLRSFAKAGHGLFAVSDDMQEIISAYRSQQPPVIIVDDAQISLRLIEKLIHFRKETGASFNILASCWHGNIDTLTTTLNLPENRTHILPLLSRDEIVEVIKDAGIIGPDRLVKEIVDQAEGRPGLAATLVHLCLQGDIKRVFLGESLSSSVRRFFEPQLGKRVISLLAAFSIGGDFGMSIQNICKALDMNITEVQSTVVQLATGGILWEVDHQNLSVHPEALRHTFVKDIFFSGAYSLPIQPLLDNVPYLPQSAITIVGAYACGADISWSFLIEMLEKAGSSFAWQQFAGKGEKESRWVVEHHPELLINVAFPALFYIPNITLPMLFERAVGDDRPLHSTTEHPLRLIQDWVKKNWPGNEETLRDREILIDSACSWLRGGNDIQVGLKALWIAFNPVCEETITDPGAGNRFTIRNTYLLPEEMKHLHDYWPMVVEQIKGREINNWKPLLDIAHSWVFPELYSLQIPEDTRELMRSFAKETLKDVSELAGECRGILHSVKQMAQDGHIDLNVEIDGEFEILYPIEKRKNYREEQEEQRNAVDQLAFLWSKQPSQEVARKLFRFEQEAINGDVRWPRWSRYLCIKLSGIINNPENWAQTFMDEKLPAELILPFIEKSAQLTKPGWFELVRKCISQPPLKEIAVEICLTQEQPSIDLVSEIQDHLSGYEELIETLCLRSQVNEGTVRRLLKHPRVEVRAATAQGIWHANKEEGIPEALVEDWLMAVLQSNEDHLISSILKKYPELAFLWLQKVIQGNHQEIDRHVNSIRTAAAILKVGEKNSLLGDIPDNWHYAEIVNCLVGNDMELYRLLLVTDRLRIFHLVPLIWEDSLEWIEKARIASAKGYSASDIAYAAYEPPYRVITWSGKESKGLQVWGERFTKLISNQDTIIREIGLVGKSIVEEKLKKAIKRERAEEVFGDKLYRKVL